MSLITKEIEQLQEKDEGDKTSLNHNFNVINYVLIEKKFIIFYKL
jgi:hypothetical protein